MDSTGLEPNHGMSGMNRKRHMIRYRRGRIGPLGYFVIQDETLLVVFNGRSWDVVSDGVA